MGMTMMQRVMMNHVIASSLAAWSLAPAACRNHRANVTLLRYPRVNS